MRLYFSDQHVFPHSSFSNMTEDGSTNVIEEQDKTFHWIADQIRKHKPELVVNLGDSAHNFGELDSLSLRCLYRGWEQVKWACDAVGAPYRQLLGNHDFENEAKRIHCFPFVSPIDLVSETMTEGTDLFVPFYRDPVQVTKTLTEIFKKNKIKTAYIHLDYIGALMNAYMVPSKKGVDPELFKGIRTFAGHYHHPQIHGDIVVVGSTGYRSFVDCVLDTPRGIVLDTGKTFQRIENPHTSMYFSASIESIEDIHDIPKYVDKSRTYFLVKFPDVLAEQPYLEAELYYFRGVRKVPLSMVSSVVHGDLPKSANIYDVVAQYITDNPPEELPVEYVQEHAHDLIAPVFEKAAVLHGRSVRIAGLKIRNFLPIGGAELIFDETGVCYVDGRIDGMEDGDSNGCFVGSTKISLLDGTERTLESLIGEKEFWVYSTDERGKFYPGKAHSARKTKSKVPVYKVTLDNGLSAVCTPDHKWLKRDGKYARADELKTGDSLMPLYRKVDDGGYEQYYDNHHERWYRTHWSVSHNIHRPRRKGYVTHHSARGVGGWFNKRNNDPRFLKRMATKAHWQLHHDEIMTLWGDPEFRERKRKIDSDNMKLRWKNDPSHRRKIVAFISSSNSDPVLNAKRKQTKIDSGVMERYAATRRKFNSEDHPNLRNDVTLEMIAEVVCRVGSSQDCVSKKLACSKQVLYNRIVTAGFKTWTEFTYFLTGEVLKSNGKVGPTNVLAISGIEKTVYDWAKESGINSNTIYSRIRRGWPNDLLLEEVRNHKVVSVEFAGYQDVYDITVDKYHNFALSAGVFVHNSGKSSLFEAMYWCLFGELIRKGNAEDVVNSEAGCNCRVDVTFYVNENEYIVSRMRKDDEKGDSYCVMYQNGELLSEGWEQTNERIVEVMGCTSDIFKHTTFLIDTLETRFSHLNQKERVQLLESILMTEVYGELVDVCHQRVKKSREQLIVCDVEEASKAEHITTMKETMQQVIAEREQLTSRGNASKKLLQEEINSYETTLADVKRDLMVKERMQNKLKAELHAALAEEEAADKELWAKKKEVSDLTLKQEQMQEEMEQLKGKWTQAKKTGVCPYCGAKPAHSIDWSRIDVLKTLLSKDTDKLALATEQMTEINHWLVAAHCPVKDLDNKQSALSQEVYRISAKLEELPKNIKARQKAIAEFMEESNDSGVVEKMRKDIDVAEVSLLDIREALFWKGMDLNIYSYLETVFGPRGCRLWVLTEAVSTLSRLSADNIDFLSRGKVRADMAVDEKGISLPVGRVLDNGELSKPKYGLASGGERRKVDLGIQLGISRFSSMYSGFRSNILFLDEIDEKLDSASRQRLVELLEKIAVENKQSIYIASHHQDISGMCSKTITMLNEDGVSRIAN